MGGYAWVTLATNDAYSLGALVLAHSLRQVGTKHELACLVTPGVTATMREKLAAVFALVQEVNVLDSKDEANLALLARPELGITFTKLHCWRLTQYEKCVFLDADTLVIRNCDELFEREELSAAPDVGWPDCFNSGVFVFKPSQQTFASITAFAAAKGSFDGGDQGLLNMFFSDWATKDISKHLPFIYNLCSTATYSYLPAFKQFGDDVRIIHFIGITKPWLQYFDTLTGTVQPPPGSSHLQPLLQLWWNIFCEQVHPQLSPSMTGIAGALAQMTLGEARSSEQVALEEHMRKQSWEQGQIDYMGRDSFDNIWKKICETLSFTPQQQSTPLKEDATLETTVKEIAPKETPEAPADVKVDTPAVEAEKDPTQSLIREISQEEKLSTTQLEQKTPALISEKDIVEEAVTTKAPSEPVQDVCTRTETKPEAVKSCETSAQVPQSLSESLPAVQCELPSPLVCKMPGQEASTPVTKIGGIESTPTEAKSETTTSTDQAVTQPTTPISLDSPQDITVTSKVQKENATKRAIESTPDVTQPLTIDPGEQHAEMLLAASEISTVSPVPIQVAESVLQAEPKESVLGAATVVSDQAIATTVTAVHEPTDITPTPAPIESVQLNGSACEIERRSDAILASSLPEKTDSSTEAAKEPASDLVTTKEISPVIEEKIATSSDTVSLEKSVKESEQVAKSETSETKPVEQIEIEMAELKLSGQTKAAPEKSAEQAEKATSIEAEASEAAARSSSEEVSELPITEQSSLSEGPIDAKLSNVPSTPTVIEATPPTSPSAESAQETEEAKKSLKKSDSTDGAEGESADKKGTKKTVKKITKKPKTKSEEASTAATEGTAADNSQIHKAKKTVKTTKKTSTKTLETDASVPETPPPPASAGAGGIEAPVPPKRKTKSANTKGKKSEVEE
ncbi:neurofilament heavy polypeptide isoform X2 [Cardiocondyla obscurior]|uniref:neurofilament heavy polypeptide isoform X2 n=1 Tax=Cardiocondyla obscurior TaxID=286306 RepID=UPI003965648A